MPQPGPSPAPTSAFRGDDVTRSSDGLGWSALRLEHRITRGGGAGEGAIAFEDDLLIVHRRPARMWQAMDGVGRDVLFRPGDALLLPAACPVLWRWDGGAETIVLALPAQARAPVPVLADWRVAAIAARLLREAAMPDAGPLLADALTLALAGRLGRGEAETGRDGPLDDRRLRRALDCMAAAAPRSPGVAELARAAGLSPAHFARAFRARTGVAPHAWLATLRLERALDLLRRPGSAPVLAEVAAAAGFADQAHMTRELRRATGLTPGALRR